MDTRTGGKLNGKVAIVTGASRGIGQMIAELFASEGARVVCAARTMNEGEHRMLEGSLARTVEAIKAKDGEARPAWPTCPPRPIASPWSRPRAMPMAPSTSS